MSPRLYLALVPWIVFALIGPDSLGAGVAWGAIAALATALVIVAISLRTRSVKDLEIFGVGLFATLAVWGASDPAGALQRFHSAIAVGALALFAVASLGFQPFTEPYAREIVQRKYWTTSRFNRTNVELTLMWAVVFAGVAASQAAGGAINTTLASTIFGWLVPAVIVVAGVTQAATRWNDQFDGESMGLDALLNQHELWDARGPEGPGGRHPA
jgi:hypothetical protein